VPVNFIRVALICGLLAALAMSAPKFAPDLLAAFLPKEEPATSATASAARPRPPAGRKVAIDADPRGHFFADAVVEGRTISVVVDTGATTVALTAETARRLGIRLSPAAYNQPISTANGVVAAAPVTLSEIRLGGITVRDVGALVVPSNALDVNLLGMTFLSRLTKFEVGGGQLVLTE
jgi:aspartyl protease family protein